MAFDLDWDDAPLPDFTDHDLTFGDGGELGEQGMLSGSDEEGQYQEANYGNPIGETNNIPTSSRAQGKGKKKGRTSGGLGGPKKLTLDYDSDDGRLIKLKKSGHTDEQVVQKFKEEKRIDYEAKTVNSRWIRLRKLLIQQENERLDDELSDWHEGEDDKLGEIAKAVAPKYDHQFQLLEQRRWHEISLHLAEKLGQRKYTGKACRDRAEGLKDGTALPPIELAEDQEERRQMTADRIAAAKKARQDERDARRAKLQRAEARAAAKKREAAESEQRKIDDALKKRAEKDEAGRIREERKENKEKMKHHRVAVLAQLRAEKEWVKTRQEAEKNLYRSLTGNSIDGKRAGKIRKTRDGYESNNEEELPDEFESDDEEDVIDLPDDEESDEDAEHEIDDDMADLELQDPTPKKPRKNSSDSSALAGHVPAPVTRATLLNPRSIMSDNELEVLLHFRDLPRRGADETHAEVVARLAAADDALKSEELSQYLIYAAEKSKGKKFEKVARLREADARECEQGQMGVTSTDLEFVRRYEGYSGEFGELVREMEEKAKAGEEGEMEE